MFNGKTPDKLSLILSDFWEQLFPQVQDADAIPKIVKRIEMWVGQQPAMTSVLCSYVIKYASQINEEDAAGIVDRIVHRDILSDWENSNAATHLNKIAATITGYSHRDMLLLLYMQILQRGSVSAKKSPEQEALIRSGLVVEKNRKLSVANQLYRQVFDAEWIEQQLPGITRPVAIVETSAAQSKQPSLTAGLYSKLAVAACCVAVLGAGISAYLREASSQAALATQDTVETVAPVLATESAPQADSNQANPSTTDVVSNTTAAETAVKDDLTTTDRVLYDQGVEHATNGRWLPMAREFCQLSESSTYFWTAEKQLEKWLELYPEEIAIAQDTFSKETGATCPVLTKAVEKTTQSD